MCEFLNEISCEIAVRLQDFYYIYNHIWWAGIGLGELPNVDVRSVNYRRFFVSFDFDLNVKFCWNKNFEQSFVSNTDFSSVKAFDLNVKYS